MESELYTLLGSSELQERELPSCRHGLFCKPLTCLPHPPPCLPAILPQQDDGTTAACIGNPATAEFEVCRTSLLPGALKTLGEGRAWLAGWLPGGRVVPPWLPIGCIQYERPCTPCMLLCLLRCIVM